MKLYLMIATALVATVSHSSAGPFIQTPSPETCQQIAIDYAQRESLRGEIFVGTGIGALAGLGIGSMFAASGGGAAIGATVGALGGIIVREQRYGPLYVGAYRECMSNRIARRSVR
jgi:uncharacterized protein YcfJ